jgi:hypothetical protein
MAGPTLKSILSVKSGSRPAVQALMAAMGGGFCVLDTSGKILLGEAAVEFQSILPTVPVEFEGTHLGSVVGPADGATALASMLSHLIARECDGRSLAAEVLHLYREVHLIEELSEQLAALLNLPTVCQSALNQAHRLIRATHGGILVMEKAEGRLSITASFGPVEDQATNCPLSPDSLFVASIMECGIAEIVNNCEANPRVADSERELRALVCAPLRAGQRTVGVIALASTVEGASYSAADLKLLNTIALQTAAAIANALLAGEMVEAARVRTALAAELHAASTVQQLLLQSASRPTPGFEKDSVYVPASEVGGDFFFVFSAPDGSIIAVLGDVSGKGLTAAMRVAMILGVLRRETSHDPGEILAALNNALITQGDLGFTTACCIRISPAGEFALANAGQIAPYVSGREIESPAALPLGLVPDQRYELVHGTLKAGERLVMMSDGVLEARSETGELYGFERLSGLTLMPARAIAEAAQIFGQEDDITVLTLALAPQ